MYLRKLKPGEVFLLREGVVIKNEGEHPAKIGICTALEYEEEHGGFDDEVEDA